jgi:hypothetical protein
MKMGVGRGRRKGFGRSALSEGGSKGGASRGIPKSPRVSTGMMRERINKGSLASELEKGGPDGYDV